MTRVAILLLLFAFIIVPLTAASASTVTIGEYFSESEVTAPIMINDVEDLAAATIKVSYDPEVVIVTKIDAEIPGSFTPNLYYASDGWVKMAWYVVDSGLSGDITFAELTISPRGNYGAYSTLDIEVETLSDTEYRDIDADVIDGFFYIGEVFSTGTGTYPSVVGTHNGTITPSIDINVSRMCTYPCPGTGGHTEYVKIWNSTDWNVTATWKGYTGDWHNLTFNDSFILYANETYNYTIRTDSYPQIIHEQSWNATGGFITCEEFVDINGKRHEGWIPAIRLY